jgi:hypothetical protein
MRVLHRKIKYQKQNMRALLDPMFKFVKIVHKANPKKRQYHLQNMEVLLKDLDKKKWPIHPLTWRRKVGKSLKTTINESIL